MLRKAMRIGLGVVLLVSTAGWLLLTFGVMDGGVGMVPGLWIINHAGSNPALVVVGRVVIWIGIFVLAFLMIGFAALILLTGLRYLGVSTSQPKTE